MISFDAPWYLQTYPEVRHELDSGNWATAEVHYHQRGSREGRSPGPYFDENWYRGTYPDVAERIAAGVYRSGFHQYLLYGYREQRSPNPTFDEQWYLRTNPDVAAAVASGDLRCGFDHFLRSGEFEGRRPNATVEAHPPPTNVFIPSVAEYLLPYHLHVWNDPSKRSSPRLNLVLPSLRMEHMSGGPNTALTLVCELSRLGIPIRLLAGTHGVDPDPKKVVAHIASLAGAHSSRGIEMADPSNPDAPAAIGSNDVFFATAWWTAQLVAEVLPRMRKKTFFYLIQDFEPGFQAWSTDYSLALETYDMDIIPVINSSSLRDYLLESRVGRFADPAFRSRVISFEPAVDRRYFHRESRPADHHRRLLFYARPNIAKRNLFEIGLSALIKAVSRGCFSPDQWTLHFIGEGVSDTAIGNGVVIRQLPWLDFSSYARLLRQSDILLSLMLSPHPSYAPLEMAACGGIVVTNSFGCKTQDYLAGYSSNILAPPPYARQVSEALERAAEMAVNRGATAVPTGLPSTWQESFAPILPRIKVAWESLQ